MYINYGQTPVCTPNILYKDSAAGIYPRPYNDSTKVGGISKTACKFSLMFLFRVVSIPAGLLNTKYKCFFLGLII